MASVTENELKSMTQEERVKALGMTSEQLTGRSMFMEFDPGETERYEYPWAPKVDFNKRTELDTVDMTSTEVNSKIKELMSEGYGTIVLKNPRGKHSLAVGILSKLNLIIEGSTGYFGVGLIDGPNVRINGRVGWSCGENMMSGTVLIEKNAGSTFGAAIRGGDLVCKGSVGSRTGIDMKGGTITGTILSTPTNVAGTIITKGEEATGSLTRGMSGLVRGLEEAVGVGTASGVATGKKGLEVGSEVAEGAAEEGGKAVADAAKTAELALRQADKVPEAAEKVIP